MTMTPLLKAGKPCLPPWVYLSLGLASRSTWKLRISNLVGGTQGPPPCHPFNVTTVSFQLATPREQSLKGC